MIPGYFTSVSMWGFLGFEEVEIKFLSACLLICFGMVLE